MQAWNYRRPRRTPRLAVASRGTAVVAVICSMLMLVAMHSVQAADQKKPRRTSRPADNSGIVYRWVDNNGTVHYGDQVPPEYAPMDRDILNQQGVALRSEQGLLTPEELAAEAQAKAEKAAAEAAARRDKVLLSTYLSVEEIEGLRDRRIELIDGQISVITIYLQSLKDNLKLLQAEAGRYKPYSQDPDAEPIDEQLAKEIADTVDSIALYEKTLQDTRSRQARVITAFDADISRFQELKAH